MAQESKILVVDDNELNREMLKSFLEEKYTVLEAEDGEQALEILRDGSEGIEGIVLDLVMPRMDGYTFLEHYSKNEVWKNIPVLVATADEDPEVENKCLTLGAWDFVHKPFNPATVFLRLENTVSRKRVEQMEQQRITDLFQKYVEPAVLDELLRSGVTDGDLKGKNVEVAVLFADIRGFTTISEIAEPNEIVDILDTFLTMTSRAIDRTGGTLDKFMGDCVMAFWGAPLPCEDKVYLACKAAWDMVAEAEEMEEELLRRFGQRVSFGVGVHVGPAVVGSIGSPERKDYTAIGDTVNTASRLESVAPAGTIYISRAVADRLGDRATVTSLGGSIPLKGKTAGFEVLTLDHLVIEENGRTTERPTKAQSVPEFPGELTTGEREFSQKFSQSLAEIKSVAQQFSTLELTELNPLRDFQDNDGTLTKMLHYVNKLYQLVYVDSLTGVKNRLAYQERVTNIERKIHNRDIVFGVVVMDIESLKEINDAYGYTAGDELVISSSELICDAFKYWPVYRFGGAEFVTIFEDKNAEEAEELLRQFRKSIKQHNQSAEPRSRVSISYGMALYDPEADHTYLDVFKRADEQMHERVRESLN